MGSELVEEWDLEVRVMKVRQAAELAKLALSPEEEVRMEAELGSILQFVQQMRVEDTPEISLAEGDHVLRDDVVRPSMERETLLSLAPSRTDEYMTAPKTLAEEGEA